MTKSLGLRSLSRGIKIQLRNTLLRPEITYGTETWPLRKMKEKKLIVLERKILKIIFCPIKDEKTTE